MKSIKEITDSYRWKKPSYEDIEEQTFALMHEIEESNKDMHDNCDMNDCRACIGE